MLCIWSSCKPRYCAECDEALPSLQLRVQQAALLRSGLPGVSAHALAAGHLDALAERDLHRLYTLIRIVQNLKVGPLHDILLHVTHTDKWHWNIAAAGDEYSDPFLITL